MRESAICNVQFSIKLSLLFFALFIIRNSLFVIPVFAASSLDQINQKVCDRFEADISKLAAIMEEAKSRKGITETRVAFGGIDTPIKSADYQITYVAEALAFQRAQKYSSKNELKYSLEVLKNKILQAKNQVGEVLNND